MRHRGSGLDDAQGDEVIADAAGQLAAQRMLGRHEQGVGAVGGQGDVGGRGGVHHLLGVAAEDAAVLVVVGQHGGVAVAQPQAGVLFPGGAEPDRFGEPGVAEGVGEQGHAAAVLHRLQLAGVPGQNHLPVAGLGVGDQVGQVRAGHGGGLIDQQQRPRAGLDRAAGAAPARQVAQELGAVVRDRDPGGQGVAGRLRRSDSHHRAQLRCGPRFAGLRQHVGLAGPGRRVDHRDALAVGQDRQHRGGLIRAQPGPRAWRVRVVRAAGQRVLQLRRVGAEGARSLRAGQARRAARACLREHAFFHDQLRARGVPGAAVPLVDAAPVGAQQAARNGDWLGCFQAGDWLELRAQCPVGQVLQQRGGRGGVHSGAGQDPAQVLDHIRARPGALFLLRERDRLLRRARQLELGEDRALCAVRVRGAAGCAVPDRWRDRRQAHAERARELVRPARVHLRDIQRAVLRVARLEVGRLREMRELALGRRAAVALLEPRRAGAQVGGDGLPARGEQPHHLPADSVDLEPVSVIAGDPLKAEPARERFLQVLGDDRGDRADVLVVTERVRRPPLPVGGRLGDVGDLGVDVQLHVAVAGGVLQPVRHGQIRLVPLAGLPAVHPGVVRPGAGVAGLPLEVPESGVHGLPDHVVDLCDEGRPVLIAVLVSCLAGQAGVLAEGGVEDRDGLGQRQG